MKKSRWADWFLTAGFLGFLALALAVTPVSYTHLRRSV